jgi:hypothetical protein
MGGTHPCRVVEVDVADEQRAEVHCVVIRAEGF